MFLTFLGSTLPSHWRGCLQRGRKRERAHTRADHALAHREAAAAAARRPNSPQYRQVG